MLLDYKNLVMLSRGALLTSITECNDRKLYRKNGHGAANAAGFGWRNGG
jgi:hypothetical protein